MKKQILFILIGYLFAFPVMGSAYPHWSFDSSSFDLDMELFFIFKQNGQKVEPLEKYEIAAFSGDECRGIAEVISVGGTDLKIYSLRIYGKSTNEKITFKVFSQT